MQSPIRPIVALMALGIAAGACSAEPTEPGVQSPESGTHGPATVEGVPLQLRKLDEAEPFSSSSGVRDRARIVIRTSAEWEDLWSQVTANTTPRPEPPAVDFAAEMVVVAAMGWRPSGGYSIEIEEVLAASGVLTAIVHERSPAPTCFVTAALTAPIEMVVVPRTDVALATAEKATSFTCG
ncbi:MAG TPA: protease complex subunit PrcB family protein [Gemmatimonadaceae bacterium]|nr:protease complex subunit PrcB family protein [Gemmatimonadaceae bacterium]